MANPALRHVLAWRDVAHVVAALGARRALLSFDATGDVALTALAAGVERAVVVAPGEAERSLLALKLAAIRLLPIQSVRALFGLGEKGRRVWFYHYVRDALPDEARRYWDGDEPLIRAGLADAGAWLGVLDRFRTRYLRLLRRPADVAALLALADPVAQRALLDDGWTGWRWRFLIQRWLAPEARAEAGIAAKPGNPVGEAYPIRLRRGLVNHPVRENPFAQRWLSGRWPPTGNGAAWLDPEALPAVAKRLDRLEVRADAPPVGDGSFDAVDLDRWGELDEPMPTLDGLAEHGAVAIAWRIHAALPHAAAWGPGWRCEDARAAALLSRDRSLFGGACQVMVRQGADPG